MALEAAINFTVGYLNGKVGEAVPVAVLALIMPQIMAIANVDRFDAKARGELQATVDDALLAVGAI